MKMTETGATQQGGTQAVATNAISPSIRGFGV